MEPTTFESLFSSYFQHVFRYALWLCGNREEAEEIAAAAFLRAWTSAPLREGTAKSYLLPIARNLFLDGRRRGRKFVSLKDAAVLRSNQSDPEATAHSRQMWAAVGNLEEKYREPLTLWAGGGLSYEEIATELRIPMAMVKTRIHRARLLLAKKLRKGE